MSGRRCQMCKSQLSQHERETGACPAQEGLVEMKAQWAKRVLKRAEVDLRKDIVAYLEKHTPDPRQVRMAYRRDKEPDEFL